MQFLDLVLKVLNEGLQLLLLSFCFLLLGLEVGSGFFKVFCETGSFFNEGFDLFVEVVDLLPEIALGGVELGSEVLDLVLEVFLSAFGVILELLDLKLEAFDLGFLLANDFVGVADLV